MTKSHRRPKLTKPAATFLALTCALIVAAIYLTLRADSLDEGVRISETQEAIYTLTDLPLIEHRTGP